MRSPNHPFRPASAKPRPLQAHRDQQPEPSGPSTADDQATLCSACQAKVTGGRFCPNCGAKLVGQAAVPTRETEQGARSPLLTGDAEPLETALAPDKPRQPGAPAGSATDASNESATPARQRGNEVQAPASVEGELSPGIVESAAPSQQEAHPSRPRTPQQAEPEFRIVCADHGVSIPLANGELTIGQLPSCDLVLDDAYVSRQHVRLTRSDGKLLVEDLGSSNGTFLKLRRSTALEVGDEILVGTQVLRIDAV